MEKTLQLSDGRKVERTVRGRWREVGSGRFVSKEEVDQIGGEGERQKALLAELMAAVNRAGYEIRSPEEAWGVILGVQAEIALDKGGGSKATAAAKFLRETISPDEEDGERDEALVLGKELALVVLELIEDERPVMGAKAPLPGMLEKEG